MSHAFGRYIRPTSRPDVFIYANEASIIGDVGQRDKGMYCRDGCDIHCGEENFAVEGTRKEGDEQSNGYPEEDPAYVRIIEEHNAQYAAYSTIQEEEEDEDEDEAEGSDGYSTMQEEDDYDNFYAGNGNYSDEDS